MKKKTKTKIAFWSPGFGKIGTLRALTNSALILSQNKNIECNIINVLGEFDNVNFKKIKNKKLIPFSYLNFIPKNGIFFSRLSYLLIFLISFFPLYFHLKKNKYDYIVIYLISSLPLFLIKFFNLETKIVFRISGKININFLRRKLWNYSKSKVVAYLFQTSAAKKKFNKIFDNKKTHICYDPVINITEIDEKKRKKINHFVPKFFFVAIGRLTQQKNFLFLVKQIHKIFKIYKNLNLLILGEGEDKNKIQSYIDKNNLNKRIKLMGYKKNIFNYLYKSQALICSSIWEEPGFIIQEAAATKTNIITSNCPNGPGEFIEFGKTGFLFKNNNKNSFYLTLLKFLKTSKNEKKK